MRAICVVAAVVLVWAVDAAEPLRVTLTFDDALKDHLAIAAPMLEARGWRGTFNLVTSSVGKDGRYLSWEDVKELVKRGHEVTTHTVDHPNLVSWLEKGRTNEVVRQLAESRDAIFDRTGFMPRFVCFPFGCENEELKRLGRQERLTALLRVRHNFGQGNEDAVGPELRKAIQRGDRCFDVMHHGISAEDHGGWRPFRNRKAFARHLDMIAELEREGKLIVTDYDGLRSNCRLVAKVWPRHGILSLTFDDGYFDTWKAALPLFAKYDARVSFVLSWAIDDVAMNFARLAHDQGHEVGIHGYKHRNVEETIGKIGAEDYWKTEIVPQLAGFEKAGVPRPRIFAYPNSSRTPDTDRLFFDRGFVHLRGKSEAQKALAPKSPGTFKAENWVPLETFEPAYRPAVDILAPRVVLSSILIGSGYHTSVDDVIRSLQRAGRNAEWLSLASHAIRTEARGIDVTSDLLERILAAADRSGVVVRGLR